ncbi:MAG: hypothetical protein RLZZ499_3171 [Cyanobacteriota bacterium]|jgi:hypothetical protein
MFTSKIKVKSWWGIALLTAIVTIVSPSSVKAEQDNMFEMIGSEDFLQMTAKMMNSSLPMMVDADTQWDSSSAGPGKTLSYNYTLINYSTTNIDSSLFANNIRSTMTKTVCTTPAIQIFPDNGVSLNFNYYDNTRNLIAKIQVAPSDCQ